MTLLSSVPGLDAPLAGLLADASFLTERLAGDWVAPGPGRRRTPPDPASYGRGHDEVAAACAGARLLHLPDQPWARLLVEHLTDSADSTGDWPGAYGWLIGPMAARAWAPLADQLPGQIVTTTLAAHVRRSGFWLAPALHRGFAAFREQRMHRLDIALAERAADGSPAATEIFAAYRRHAGAHGIGVWRRQPIVARLAAQLATDEVALIRQLLDHLDADAGMLTSLLRVDHLAPLTELVTGLGDRHDGGRSVCRLRFADGHQLIYRPRRHDGMELLRETVPELTPWQLHRAHHSWVGFMYAGTPADPYRYHSAAGALLAALHVAGATDIHRDNIVRTARGPAVIDAETLAHPVTAFETALTDQLADRPLPPSTLVDSVLRIGLLPAWDFTAEGALLDGAHLLPSLPGNSRISLPRITHPGTDAETLTYAPAPLPGRHELPTTGYDPAPYADVVADAYGTAMGAIDPYVEEGRHLRLLLRYTRRYIDVLLRALDRDLRDGIDLEVALQALPDGGADITPAIRAAELADLRGLDVPYFEWQPADGTVWHTGEPIAATAAHRPRPTELATEQALIRSTMRAHDGRPSLAIATPTGATDISSAYAARADLIADALLTDLAARAVPTADGVTWFGFEHRQGRFTRMPVGWSLYDGQAGIALALAAGAGIDSDLRAVTELAVTPLLNRVLTDAIGLCRNLGPGYLHGAAGVLWALRRLSHLVVDWPGGIGGHLHRAANLLAQTLSAQLLQVAHGGLTGTGLDLADGAAGALAVLAEPGLSDLGRVAAIASTARELAAGSVHVDGLAHGSAGVALGLWRAATALGDGTLAAAAHRHLAQDHATGWTWCTGRTGVDLAASGIGISTGVGGRIPFELPADAPHHLCCGVVGHGLTTSAYDGGVAVLDRLSADGTPRYLKPLPPGLHQPGLMQGAAGVALGVLLLTRGGLPDPLRISTEALP